MRRLVLINGAPATGKSTIAQQLAQGTSMALALDIDLIKHSLGQWESDATAAGYQARRLALAMAEEQLGAGHDVIVGQFLARAEFIEQLELLAMHKGAGFFEFVLVVDQRTLLSRLEHRAVQPDRREHEVNARLVSASDVPELIASMEHLLVQRRSAIPIDASGTTVETLTAIRRRLPAGA